MKRDGQGCRYHQLLGSREVGGAGLVGLRIAEFLQRGGLPSLVWVPGDGASAREANSLGLRTQIYDPAPVLQPGRVKTALESWKIARRLRRHGSGLVHVHSLGHYGSLSFGLRHSGLANVVHVHLEEAPVFMSWALKRPPDLIITCARFLVDHVRAALPVPNQKRQWIEAVPNAVDAQRFCPGDKNEAKKRLGAPLGVPLLLMLANLAPHKGQETAIRATAALKRRGVHVACWLAGVERGGQGPYTAGLRSLIHELQVEDRVQLVGYRNDAPDLLRAADLFLLPSTSEGLPLSILEAQVSKVPVLAAPTAGIPEVVINGATGFLLPAGDAEAYARCVVDVLSNPELYHRVAEAGHAAAVQGHNFDTFCQRIWGLYQHLTRGRPSNRPWWHFWRRKGTVLPNAST